jgi:hypothetical protein
MSLLSHPAGQAAIRPELGTVDEPRSQGIALDVAAQHQELALFLDWDRAISFLIDVAKASRASTHVSTPNVRTGQPVHVARKITRPRWPEDEMPVVGHQAIRKERDVHASGGQAEQADKFLVVFRIAKHLLPGVPPVDHMLDGARFDDATPAWHEHVLRSFR